MRLIYLVTAIACMTIGINFSAADEPAPKATTTAEVKFKSHDEHEMFGKLTLPALGAPRAVVIYIQTAEGATVDMKRRKSREETFNYFDLYREKLTAMNIGFFSYEGRGLRMGSDPPRFETIDWNVYNTSSLENKVRDALSAIAVVRQQPGLMATPIWLMGASEATLLAAETASREPELVSGLVLYGVLASNMRENFRYIMTDGAFLPLRQFFDADNDGKITPQEYEADPKKYRENTLKNAPFSALDKSGDGVFSAEDIVLLRTKPYVDAIEKEDFPVLQDWAKKSAAVAVPKDWFKDHFAHKPIWEFLSTVDIPVGCFHGALDTNTPIGAVKELEVKANDAGKAKMKFHYFENGDHSLNIGGYFTTGKMPEGHTAIFEFLDRQVVKAGANGSRK